MTTLRFLGRCCVALIIGPLFYVLFLYEMAREARKKARLGRYYEGPLDE